MGFSVQIWKEAGAVNSLVLFLTLKEEIPVFSIQYKVYSNFW